jgi:hypothetical protein
MDPDLAVRLVGQTQFRFITVGDPGPYRAWCKPAAAGWADIVQHVLDAACAICAFITADPGCVRVRWQVGIAPFTIGSDLEHFRPFCAGMRGLEFGKS